MSQGLTPSMDHEILSLFSDLKYDILRIVKKHFTRPMNVELKALESAPWKDYHPLSRENRQLWIQAFIADDLFEQFFSGKRKLFGFDAEQEQVLQDIESTLTKSGRVSEADIADWRARTVSCGQKLGPATPIALFHNLAHATLRDLGPIGPPNFSEEKEAERAMTSIYHTAFDLAILFRSNKVSYSWLQNKSPSSISIAEAGIAGVTQLDCPGLWKPWRVIFGELVKSGDSEGDRFVLAKPEVLFD